MKFKLKNPCKTCLVKVTCGQLCEDKRLYGKTLPTTSLIVILGTTIASVIPSAMVMANLTEGLKNKFTTVSILTLCTILIAIVLTFIIMRVENYMDKIRENHSNEVHDIESVKYRRMGIPIPPRCRRIP